MKHIGFGKIEQFRNVIRNICHDNSYVGQDENDEPTYDKTKKNPIVTFTGTVKLHGTNASVCYSPKTGMYVQSRNNIITVENDNAGFASFVEENREYFGNELQNIYQNLKLKNDEVVSLYGEWCGKGIQKGIGISELPKMFVAFEVKVSLEGETVTRFNKYIKFAGIQSGMPENVYSIFQFPTYEIEIDFENPLLSQPKLSELTIAVEDECPVARNLGVLGIGEGIVWTTTFKDKVYKFKVKGEKHSVSKVKVLAAVDIEKVNSVNEFVEYAVTENRLKQGLEHFEPTNENIGGFLRWVFNDIATEEADTLAENGLTKKDLGAPVAKKARNWFMGQI